jgi:hypothetical protein
MNGYVSETVTVSAFENISLIPLFLDLSRLFDVNTPNRLQQFHPQRFEKRKNKK